MWVRARPTQFSRSPWCAGEVGRWTRLIGGPAPSIAVADPFARELAGDWRGIQGNFGPPGEQVDLAGISAHANLDQLLEDLRWQSAGWLAPRLPAANLPLPLRNTWPVRVAVVMPEPAGVPPA